jgi:Putative prokaryotic signal transducing protein
MAEILPFNDEFRAHLARSKLLAHGIASVVVHDHAATVYGNWITHPGLLVADGDFEEAATVLSASDVPLGDDFVEPPEPDVMSEDLGLVRDVPRFIESITLGALIAGCMGLIIVAMLTAEAIMSGGRIPVEGVGLSVVLLPLGMAVVGALGGAFVWPFTTFARSCRRDERGELPRRAWLIYFILALEYGSFLLLPILLISGVRGVVRGLRRSGNSPSSLP